MGRLREKNRSPMMPQAPGWPDPTRPLATQWVWDGTRAGFYSRHNVARWAMRLHRSVPRLQKPTETNPTKSTRPSNGQNGMRRQERQWKEIWKITA